MALTLAAAAAQGCASWSNMGTARTLAPGHTRWSPAVTLSGAATDQQARVETLGPQMELGGDVGVTEGLELGARVWGLPSRSLWTWGARAEAKIQLYRPPNPNRGVAVALAPRAGWHQVGSGGAQGGAVILGVPLLVGVNIGGGSQVVLGPEVGGQVWLGADTRPIPAWTLGGSLGLVWFVGDCFALAPEVAVHASSLDLAGDDRVWFFQFGLGVLLDP